MDPYRELGVERTATDAEIRRAYLRLARRTHPDVRGDDSEADEKMRRLNEAWTLLSDPASRAAVDLAAKPQPAQASQPTVAGRGAPQDSDDEDHYWWAETIERDDRPLSAGRLPAWMQMGAPALFVFGVFSVIVGAMVAFAAAVVFGLVALAVSGLMFMLAPFVVLVTSRRKHQ